MIDCDKHSQGCDFGCAGCNWEAGIIYERDRILAKMQSYFDLTGFSQEVEGAPANPEWDRGYQAAMAIIKGENK